MILVIVFLVIGITAMIKQKFAISSKRQIVGVQAQYLGIIYILPAVIGIASQILKNELLGMIALIGYGVAIVVSILLIVFVKRS